MDLVPLSRGFRSVFDVWLWGRPRIVKVYLVVCRCWLGPFLTAVFEVRGFRSRFYPIYVRLFISFLCFDLDLSCVG